jgi:hypothetical protein
MGISLKAGLSQQQTIHGSLNHCSVLSFFCLVFFVPLAAGWVVTRFAGGLSRGKRVGAAAVCGLLTGIVYSLAAFRMEQQWDLEQTALLVPMIWRAFAMAIFCTLGAVIAEIRQADPDLK